MAPPSPSAAAPASATALPLSLAALPPRCNSCFSYNSIPAENSSEKVTASESDMTGRPDYSFRVAGQTKFFVEAKAPSEGLDHPKHILQAKQYAWNTRQVFFVVLTDFAEFRFYDASIRPDERKPEEGLLLRIAYADYP